MHSFDTRTFFLAILVTVTVASAACTKTPSSPPTPEPAQGAVSTQTPVEHGKVLVTVGGCHDCHTPKKFGPKGPEPDMSRMLSGHPEDVKVTGPFKAAPGTSWIAATNEHLTAWSGPWGVSFTANLTPDTLTGLRSGVWTEELFIKALRAGKPWGLHEISCRRCPGRCTDSSATTI